MQSGLCRGSQVLPQQQLFVKIQTKGATPDLKLRARSAPALHHGAAWPTVLPRPEFRSLSAPWRSVSSPSRGLKTQCASVPQVLSPPPKSQLHSWGLAIVVGAHRGGAGGVAGSAGPGQWSACKSHPQALPQALPGSTQNGHTPGSPGPHITCSRHQALGAFRWG